LRTAPFTNCTLLPYDWPFLVVTVGATDELFSTLNCVVPVPVTPTLRSAKAPPTASLPVPSPNWTRPGAFTARAPLGAATPADVAASTVLWNDTLPPVLVRTTLTGR